MADPYASHPLKRYAPMVRSRSLKLLANGKSMAVFHFACAPVEHRFSKEDRRQRRVDNQQMKMMRLITRGRNKHGRKGHSARKAFVKSHS